MKTAKMMKATIVLVMVLMLLGCATGPTSTTEDKVDCAKINNFTEWAALFLVGAQAGSAAFGPYAPAAQASVVAANTALDLLKSGCQVVAGKITPVDVAALTAQVMDEIAKINAVGAAAGIV